MNIGRIAAVMALGIAAAGCATIIRGTKQEFAIVSQPPSATATLSTGQTCITPCNLKLPRKDAFDVTLTLDGYEPATAHVNSGWSRGGTQTFVVGNIIAGGLIGMGVDASNGATRDLTPNPVSVTLTPIVPPPPPIAAVPEVAPPAADAAPVETPAPIQQ
jgi:hypothetical protein